MLRKIVVGVSAVLMFGVAALLFRLWRSVPPLSGRETLPGLSDSVVVRFDRAGVPHISASTDSDALAALGYLHARDRLWQMETLRRAAEGRLSEVFGSTTLGTDRFLRSLDIPHVARRSLELMPAETRALLDAYVAGINRWVGEPERPLPPEFLVMRFRPEPWTAAQVAGIARIMAWDLAQASLELSLARTAARVGSDRVAELFPDYPDDGPVILEEGTYSFRWTDGPTARQPARGGDRGQRTGDRRTDERRTGDRRPDVPTYLLAEGDVPQIPALAAEMLDAAAMSRASNSWVIGPARSASGKPILANDPHLNLRAPSLWYLVAIESPTLRVAGGTIPGLPPVVLGHNRRIAWGLTNVEADDVDYVIERLTPDSSRVATPLGMVAVVEVRDTIRVRGAAPVPYTLRRTPNGPLVPRAEIAGPPGDGLVEAVAMRWTGHQPSDELTALLGVNRAGSWTEFLAAVALFRSPEQNWVYADVDGNIGYVTGGAIPVRRSGTGLLPTPGWTGEGSWDRFLDFDELPRAFNPPAGFIVTANNRVVGPEYPWTMSRSWGAPYRAQRIVQLIGDGRSSDAPVTVTDPRSAGPSVRRSPDSFSADDVARMQLDSLDLFAAWAKEIAAAAAERAGFGEQAAALRAWDGSAGTGSAGPTLFWVWYRLLQRYSLEDELGGGVAPSSRLHAWLRAGGSSWFDDVRTPEVEDLAALATRAMREAVPMADGRTWGAAHVTLGRHAMGDVKFLKAVLRLNTGPSPRAGSLYTVNVGEFGWFEPPFVTTHAASMRHVVDMADPDRGLFVVTSGQSGNPLSRRYRNQLPMWLKGDVLTVPLSAGRVEAAGILRLVP